MRTDRYISFSGIECDARPRTLLKHIHQKLVAGGTRRESQWTVYFTEKLPQNEKMGHDDLFFLGAQMNALYSWFEALKDDAALQMLWDLEQECC